MNKTNKIVLISLTALLFLIISIFSIVVNKHNNEIKMQNKEQVSKDLNEVILNISKNPDVSIKILSKYNVPTAKAYLAYLAFTGITPSDEKYPKVNHLMNEAIEESFDNYDGVSYGPMNKFQTYSYDNLEFLLTHIRYIQEMDNSKGIKTETPSWLFVNNPKESDIVYSPDWYFSKNKPEISKDFYIVTQIADVSSFINKADVLKKYLGIKNNNSDLFTTRLVLASLAPTYLASQSNAKASYNELLNLLKRWSSTSPSNNQLYRELTTSFDKARTALSIYYVKSYKVSPQVANQASYVALMSLFESKSEMYSRNYMELFENKLYKAIYAPNSSSNKDLANYIKANKVSQQSLNQALKYTLELNCNINMVELLLSQGAKINKQDKTTMEEAGGLLEKTISSTKPSINRTVSEKPVTLSNERMFNLIKLFIKSGYDINFGDSNNETILISASKTGNVAVAQYLISAGANVNQVTNYGYTALYWAARNNDLPMVKLLVKNGADVNFTNQDMFGNSPLTITKETEVKEFLMQSGAKN